MLKKSSKKIKKNSPSASQIKEKKFDSGKIIEPEELLEEKITEFENKINNQKFLEFLSVSTDSIETLASKKPRNVKPIEQDEDVLSENIQKKDRETKIDYFARTSKDYDLVSPREEKKQDISTKSFQPQRVDFQEAGREIRTPLRDVFVPNNEMSRLASQGRDEREEKKYDLERVDFTEVGREKRYKLMK